ncbi:MAG: prolyl-tRNA synthetase associated domain-containing protein [Hyphomicrobiaceae bacterium]
MPATRADLLAMLDELGISTRTYEHEAVFTVAESLDIERSMPGGHTKNLFLKDKKDRLFLVVALNNARIDMKTLHKRLGCDRLSFGRAELLEEVLGIKPGSVTPFSVINDKAGRVSVVLDKPMLDHEILNYHPLENTATTAIGREDLLRFIRATGHEPRIETVSDGVLSGEEHGEAAS